jgi:hypothetical protein
MRFPHIFFLNLVRMWPTFVLVLEAGATSNARQIAHCFPIFSNPSYFSRHFLYVQLSFFLGNKSHSALSPETKLSGMCGRPAGRFWGKMTLPRKDLGNPYYSYFIFAIILNRSRNYLFLTGIAHAKVLLPRL